MSSNDDPQDKPGFKNATDILSHLSLEERERILDSIAKTDPKLSENLRESLYCFDDLKYLTPLMIVEFMRAVDPALLGLALRGAKEEVKNHLLSNVSRGIKKDIEDILLGPPKPAEQVVEAIDKVMEIVLQKIEKGELVLSKDSSETIID